MKKTIYMEYKKTLLAIARQGACLLIAGLMTLGSVQAQSSHVVVNGNVFGGGNAANVSGSTTVLMDGSNATVRQDIYGGGAQAAVGTLNASNKATTAATVTVLAGRVERDVYGGGLGTAGNPATVNSTVRVNIGQNDNGTISGAATVLGNVFGCNNVNGSPKDSVRVDIWRTAHTTTPVDNSVPSYANIAALSAAIADREAGSYADACKYFALQGVYGGGNQADYVPATATGTEVYIHNCENTVKMVYGGGRAAAVGGGQTANATVIIDGGLIDTIFAGGDGHTVDPGTGNYRPADIHGNVYATIRGGYYTAVFAGSNTSGTISGTKSLKIQNDGPCSDGENDDDQEELIGTLFGGGNLADITGDVVLTIACGAGTFDEVYGGANLANIGTAALFNDGTLSNVTLNLFGGTVTNVYGGSKGVAAGDSKYPLGKAADIYGNVTLNLYGGTMTNAFGGSNINGNIAGKITVNVLDKEATSCELHVTNIYGAGNLTAYSPSSSALLSPEVNVIHIKKDNSITGSVFGGGLGLPATVTANPKVTVGAAVPSPLPSGYSQPASNFPYATVGGNVYGGGSLASVVGNTAVNISHANASVGGSVYGGGMGKRDAAADTSVAKVSGNTVVTMQDGHVEHSIYGGGEMATVGLFHFATADEAEAYNNEHSGATMAAGDVHSYISGGATTVNVTGGTVGQANLNPIDIEADGNVFGGGLGDVGGFYTNFAYVNTATVIIDGTALVRGSVFGGGENGHVKGNTSVTVDGGTVGERIKYRYRAISSDAGVSNPVYAGNVYGGGRGVDHTAEGNHLSETAGRVYGNTSVTVNGGHIRHSVYGGGSLASVGTYTLTSDATVYGGHIHNFTANTGNATVSISSGRIGPSWNDLVYNENGDYLLDGNGDPISDAARDTIAKNYAHLGENEGMVYGSGRGVNYTNDGNEDHQLYVEMAFTNNTTVTVSGNTTEVIGSVFGGGENGHVKGNTQVNIEGGTIGGIPLHHKGFYLPGHSDGHGLIADDDDNDDELNFNNTGIGKSVFRGNVYGGGRGIDHTEGDATTVSGHIFSVSAGRVYGNTVVNVTGGHILHNVFGGGSIASVGTYTYPDNNFFGNPNAANNGTGKTTVNVSGGQIGVMGENEGYVYGGGRGIAGTNETQVSHLAFVNETEVNIQQTNSTHADVRASVFGGGMNGHVLTNTVVNVSGGVIGGKTAENYGNGAASYDPTEFATQGTIDLTLNGKSYCSGIRAKDTITSLEGLGPYTVFLGNVYGGGRGVDVTSGENLSYTAGRVYGNTVVNITGGVIYHSVFGGGSIASVGDYDVYTAADVTEDKASTNGFYRLRANQPKTCTGGGTATVRVSGGRIGTNGRNNGRVFGSSRGMAGANYRGLGYVNHTDVTISDNAEVRGSVFGSGENGHVLTSTDVKVTGGHIGNGKRNDANAWVDAYVGNVYGGGRGLDRAVENASTVSPFAGRVYGSTQVTISGGQIDHNVYGGGSLASVGRYKRDTIVGSATYNEITFADADKGTATVTITGGTIGIDGDENGHVFGSSRGTASSSEDIRASLAYVNNTVVNISSTAAVEDDPATSDVDESAPASIPVIKGSVFGGGESGHVQGNATVTVSGGTIGKALTKNYASYSAAEQSALDLMGNVYGGGRGVDPYTVVDEYETDGVTPKVTHEEYSYSAGYVRGNTYVTITGTPTIYRNVYGGGSMGIVGAYGPYGADDFYRGDGTTKGVATVLIQGTVGTAANVGYGYGGNVYGSCRGKANNPPTDSHNYGELAYVFKTAVTVETGALVAGNVYGGGENGHVDFGGTKVDILNGTVTGNVFGGGKGSSTSPTAGIVDGPTQVNIGLSDYTANTVVIGGDVFAGNDAGSSPLGTMRVDVYVTQQTGDQVYPLGDNPTDEQTAAALAATDATPGKYALHAVYGGGNQASVLSGIPTTDYSGTILDNKYITQRLQPDGTGPAAGGNYSFDYQTTWPAVGGVTRKSEVYIHGCHNTIMYVYGGGRAANTIENDVTIEGGRIYQVFAGGNGSSVEVDGNPGANVGYASVLANSHNGDATILIDGGIIKQIFGGSNTLGEVRGTASVAFGEDASACILATQDVFGGGNQAPGNGDIVVTIPCGKKGLTDVYGGANEANINGNVTLNIEGGEMKRAFGGSKNANIDGNVTVNVFGGSIGELYGGNNVDGNITGLITVNVDYTEENPCPDTKHLDYVYGGGNMAAYTPTANFIPNYSPRVNIIHANIDSAVFGGGYGSSATVTSNPRVIIGAEREQRFAGAGLSPVAMAPVVPNLPVTIGTEKNVLKRTLMGNVFGGGNAAEVIGDTKVIIKGSRTKVYNNVYGGGNAARVQGNTDVEIGSAITLSAPKLTYDEGTGKVTATSYGDFEFGDGTTEIHYTLDGSTPTNASTLYEGPVTLNPATQNIRVVRYYEPLGITSQFSSYPVEPIRVPAINIDGEGKYVLTSQTLGTELFYTLDGSTPNPEEVADGEHPERPTKAYTAPITLAACQTLKAVAHREDPHQLSNIASVSTPVATPTVDITGSTVTLSTSTADATLYYTTDESHPDLENVDASGTDNGIPTKQYSTAFTLPAKATVVNVIAAKSGCPTSAMASGAIQLPAPVITISAGKVTITDAIDNVAIYYTTGTDAANTPTPDPTAVGGSNPTHYYNGTPFALPDSHTTVKAIAVKTGLTASNMTTQTN